VLDGHRFACDSPQKENGQGREPLAVILYDPFAGVRYEAKISSSVGTFLLAITLPIRDTFMRCL
jgi:hypothetical protein